MCSSPYSEHGHKMEMSGQLCDCAALPTWKEPLNGRFGGPQNQVYVCQLADHNFSGIHPVTKSLPFTLYLPVLSASSIYYC